MENLDIHTILILIDFIGIGVGIVSIFILRSSSKNLGGRVGGAINLFVWGLILMMLAFTWTLVFSRLDLLPVPGGIDAHHVLMTLGMIIFVLAARRFNSLVSG